MNAQEEPEVIYEDNDLVALNKPYGVIFDWALYKRPELIPAHRLDRDTSGVILYAKNQNAADYLKSLFQNHQIKKTYLALVIGKVKNNHGIIDLAIGRSKKNPLKRVSIGKQYGKLREAVTEYRVIKRYEAHQETSGQQGFTLVEAYPKTGRTHQIRSHFAAIGHPIVCDKLYAGKRFICPSNLSRHFLHAAAIELTLPAGQRIRLEADLPNDLENVIFSL